MEQENEKKEPSNPVEASTEARPSVNKTQKSLRVRPKIAKKSPVNDLKSKKANTSTTALLRIRRKSKTVHDAKKGSSSVEQDNSTKLNSREEYRKKDISDSKDANKSIDGQKNRQKQMSEDKGLSNQKNKEKHSETKKRGSDSSVRNRRNREKYSDARKGDESGRSLKEEIDVSKKSRQKQMSEDKGLSNQKNKEKHSETKKRGSDSSVRNQRNREKYSDARKSAESGRSLKDWNKEKNSDVGKNEERLGGLIFMCSKKTKPDCFHYRVMGVSATKKDFVLGIKPGLKLFLYDYDLKLMYGIYKASSSGGMKLEPKAFDGAFPAQVRFSVHIDCLPLPESIFKKAIKENYNEKNKFKFELTPKQVRKLSGLFWPASVYSTALHVHRSPVPKVQDREGYAGLRESEPATFARDYYGNTNSRSYKGLSHERDRHSAYGKVGSSLREEGSQDLYLSKNDYRTYGLQGERRNLTSPHHVALLDPYYQGAHEREHRHLRHLDPVFRDTIPVDPLYSNEREYPTYNVGARHELRSAVSPARRELRSAVSPAAASITAAGTNLDSCTGRPYSHYYSTSVDPYLPPPRREGVASGSYLSDRRETYLARTDPLSRRETDPVDGLYSKYAADTLSNYNQHRLYQVTNPPELAAAPVSARYSLAGRSLPYRL